MEENGEVRPEFRRLQQAVTMGLLIPGMEHLHQTTTV
jgi:hypothetical protein